MTRDEALAVATASMPDDVRELALNISGTQLAFLVRRAFLSVLLALSQAAMHISDRRTCCKGSPPCPDCQKEIEAIKDASMSVAKIEAFYKLARSPESRISQRPERDA